MKKHNYSAGPCILPQEVFEKSAQAVLNFNNSGLSLLEMSHRSKGFSFRAFRARRQRLPSFVFARWCEFRVSNGAAKLNES
jgi:phosphoserine aminotransferase